MFTCPNCHKEITNRSGICESCGNKITLPDISSQLHGANLEEVRPDLESILAVYQKCLNTTLDTSPDGAVKSFAFLWKVKANMQIYNKIFGTIEQTFIIKKTVPAFSKSDGQKVLIEGLQGLMEKYETYANSLFGEDYAKSLINVPDGCGKLWFHFVKLYMFMDEIKDHIRMEIQGIDPAGFTKAQQIFKSVSDTKEEVVKEGNDLANQIKRAGYDLNILDKQVVDQFNNGSLIRSF